MPTVDVIGHFGTTFSYASVASRVADWLAAKGLAGSVWNLDESWHPLHAARYANRPAKPADVGLVFSPPFHYMDVYAGSYKRSAIYLSQNTDRLSDEHARTAEKFDAALVPSTWCQVSTLRDAPKIENVITLRLGVSADLAERRSRAVADRMMRMGRPPEVLHFSTDQSWPGRKGTEEMLQAWALLRGSGRTMGARLTIHVPQALGVHAMLRCRDLDLEDVNVVTPPLYGSEGESLTDLLQGADLVVAPSRCEGFGLMFLASLVNGAPLVCTYGTGQADFLGAAWGWIGVPTAGWGPLFGEEGQAPVVDPHVLAQTIRAGLHEDVRRSMLGDHLRGDGAWGTWEAAEKQWDESLLPWILEGS